MKGNQSEATHARMLELIEQIKKADTAYYCRSLVLLYAEYLNQVEMENKLHAPM